MHYTIWNPTGNITALVENAPSAQSRKEIADEIFRTHPEVEQVGFLYLPVEPPRTGITLPMTPHVILSEAKDLPSGNATPDLSPALRLTMTGGEFCGNATMCAAAWYAQQTENSTGALLKNVTLSVSGADTPLRVTLKKTSDDPPSYEASLRMPDVRSITEELFHHETISAVLPVVRMPGITHILIDAVSPFYSLKENPNAAEHAVKSWCEQLHAEGLGLMFLSDEPVTINNTTNTNKTIISDNTNTADAPVTLARRMTPLVYIPGGDTLYWEHSCASGSAAAGTFFASQNAGHTTTHLSQPGGTLTVTADPQTNETILHGTITPS